MNNDDSSPPRRPATRLVTGGRDRAKSFDYVNPPLVRGSTVLHDSVADMKARSQARLAGDDEVATYGIYGTPTHHAFYAALNALEGGYRSWALPTGLAACTMALLAFVRAGDHVLIPDSVYGPTRRFSRQTLARFGVDTTFYDPCIGDELEQLFRPTTRVLFLESPGSLTFEMQDVPRLAAIARRHDAFSVIDNTWATPLFFQPLAHGVDVSLHAATKYIGGHSDLLMGTLTVNERAWPAVREAMHFYGLTTAADDVYLAHRGLHSMGARLALHRANAATTDSGAFSGDPPGPLTNVNFTTGNRRSWHPVIASTGRTNALRNTTNASFLAPWTVVGDQTMYCSDCHGSSTDAATIAPTGSAPWGPHGSANNFILKGAWSQNTGSGGAADVYRDAPAPRELALELLLCALRGRRLAEQPLGVDEADLVVGAVGDAGGSEQRGRGEEGRNAFQGGLLPVHRGARFVRRRSRPGTGTSGSGRR